MTPRKRFLLGGGGALMPVLVSILAVDVATLIDSESGLSTGNVIGFIVRYLILFAVGGVVAWLHEDETKSFKLFELGIAAPALITSLVTAQGVVARNGDIVPAESTYHGTALIQQAHAAGSAPQGGTLVAAGLIGDVWSGITGRVYKEVNVRKQESVEPEVVVDEPIEVPEETVVIEDETERLRRELEAEKAQRRTERIRVQRLEAEAAAARLRADSLERQLEAERAVSVD